MLAWPIAFSESSECVIVARVKKPFTTSMQEIKIQGPDQIILKAQTLSRKQDKIIRIPHKTMATNYKHCKI